MWSIVYKTLPNGQIIPTQGPKMTHTPTPWHAVIPTIDRQKMIGHPIINNDDGESIDNYEANAKFIVRAVNCHDELVDALEMMMDKYGGMYDDYQEADIAAKNALQKAKEQ
jgi:hypothetical protein